MTEMLQNPKNVAKNVANENSQDLTEQWKKGELINGKKYYITLFDSEPFEATFMKYAEAMIPYWKFEANGRQYCDENGYDCIKVLAPVPTFEEWQASYNCMLENEVLRLKNAELKELLEECREEIGDEIDDCTDPRIELFGKINEVLK